MDDRRIGILLFILLVVIIALGIIIYNSIRPINYTPTVYEQKVTDYFKEVTLTVEHGDNPERIIKWNQDMYLLLIIDEQSAFKGQDYILLETIENTVKEINSLTDSKFKIVLTDDLKESNSVLYITTKQNMLLEYPDFFNLIDYNPIGLTHILWDNYNLFDVKIFIDINQPLEIQQSTIIEELTHAIGFTNDSSKYPNSVLYENPDVEKVNLKFSLLDEDIIKLLYHPRIKAGMDRSQVEKEILKIFKNKEIELSGG